MSYSTSGSGVVVDLVAGLASGGDATGDTFTSIERFIGSSSADRFTASSAVTFEGGLGDDTYVVGHSSISIVEITNGGIDTIETGLTSYTLSANVENLLYTGTASATLRGNSLGNILTGSSGNDILIGGGGADTLNGGDGVDTARSTSRVSNMLATPRAISSMGLRCLPAQTSMMF